MLATVTCHRSLCSADKQPGRNSPQVADLAEKFKRTDAQVSSPRIRSKHVDIAALFVKKLFNPQQQAHSRPSDKKKFQSDQQALTPGIFFGRVINHLFGGSFCLCTDRQSRIFLVHKVSYGTNAGECLIATHGSQHPFLRSRCRNPKRSLPDSPQVRGCQADQM